MSSCDSPASQSEIEPERELAMSIRRHFGELADVLNRTAELLGDTADGERLRAAASAADRGKTSAERLYARIDVGGGDAGAVRRRA
jgi:hypothetical protein